jgi:Domain of unknown function (DUF5666)
LTTRVLAALAIGVSFIGAIGPAAAQATPPARVKGAITAIKGDVLTVTTRQGTTVIVDLAPSTAVADVTYAKITDIKPGSFIGTAAVPQPDGTLKALEVHVFAPDLRGTGEGNRAWQGDGRKGSMTNGTVGDLIVTDGRMMTVTYHGGQKKILVPADVPIVFIERGAATDLTVGAHIIAFGPKGADGAIDAARVLVGRNGVVPPM